MPESNHSNLIPMQEVSSLNSSVVEENGQIDEKEKPKSKFSFNWRSLLTIVFLWIASLLSCMVSSTFYPFFPQEAAKKGTPSSVIGLMLGMISLTVFITSPIFGYLLPCLGYSLMFSLGILIMGISYILLGLTSWILSTWLFSVSFVMLSVIQGVGTSMFFTANLSLIPHLYPNSVSTLYGIFEISSGLGFALGPVIGGSLFEWGGFELPFFVLGGSILLFWFPCIILMWKTKMKASRQSLPLKVIFKLSTDVTVIVLVLVYFIVFVSFIYPVPSLDFYATKKFGIGPLALSGIFSANAISFLIFSVIIGPITDIFGKNRIVIVTGLLIVSLSVFLLGIIESQTLWFLYVGFFVQGIGGAFATMPVYSDLLTISAERHVKDDVKIDQVAAFISGIVTSTVHFSLFSGVFAGGILNSYSSTMVLIGEIILAQASLVAGVSIIDKYTRPTKLSM